MRFTDIARAHYRLTDNPSASEFQSKEETDKQKPNQNKSKKKKRNIYDAND